MHVEIKFNLKISLASPVVTSIIAEHEQRPVFVYRVGQSIIGYFQKVFSGFSSSPFFTMGNHRHTLWVELKGASDSF